jgi:hypothetical protein
MNPGVHAFVLLSRPELAQTFAPNPDPHRPKPSKSKGSSRVRQVRAALAGALNTLAARLEPTVTSSRSAPANVATLAD